MSIESRLRHAISFTGATIAEFARHSGVPYRTLQDYLSGKRKPGADHLARMAEAGIDLNWLLTGKHFSSGLAKFVDDESGEILGADRMLTEALSVAAAEKADHFNTKYISLSGHSLRVTELQKVLSAILLLIVRTGGHMTASIEKLRGLGADRDTIVDILTSGIGPEKERQIAEQVGISLPDGWDVDLATPAVTAAKDTDKKIGARQRRSKRAAKAG